MGSAVTPPGESARLAALRRYQILDTPSEAAFDDLTALAAEICGTPIALVTLIDAHRQWFKSRVGLDLEETARESAFCNHAIQSRDILEVPNALDDERFRENPLVTGVPDIRFYAGAPLTTPDGHNLGTLCVIDRVPRRLAAPQREALRRLSRQVVTLLELRAAGWHFVEQGAFRQAILDSTALSVISTAPDGVITTFNRAAQEMLGYAPEDLIGKETPGLIHDPGEMAERAAELSRELGRPVEPGFEVFVAKVRPGQPEEREWTYIRKDGSRFPVYLSVTALLDTAGRVTGFLGLASDLTERKRLEESRRRMVDELRRSEERFARLFRADPVASCLSDLATGEFLDANDRFLELLGLPREQVIGRSSLVLGVWGDDPADRAAMVERLTRDGIAHSIERAIHRPDGRVTWVSAAARLIELEGRRQVLSTFVDITDRKRAEDEVRTLNERLESLVQERTAELRESEARFRQLAEHSEEVFWFMALNPDRVTYVSPAFERIWGLAPERLYQDPQVWLAAIHPEDRPGVADAFAACLAGRTAQFRQEYRVVRPDGATRWILASGTVIRGADGRPASVSGVARDMTERRRSEELARRSQRLEAIGTLAGGVAHDLNNALAPILMGVELLRLQRPGESELLDTFHSSAKRAAAMVRQLLTFAKGAEGERASVQPGDLLREMERIVRATFPKNITLKTRFEPDLPTVNGDATQIHQVLLNLCVNARDAMAAGGTLTLHARRATVDQAFAATVHEAVPGRYLALSVEDTGTGIPVDVLDRIFDPFFTTKGPDRGTGLGLSTVLGIVKGHRGFVQVDSELGRGCRFTVYLPAEDAAPAGPSATPAPAAFRGNGETILVLDDEPAVRDVARTVLRHLNFTVLTATDGADGLIQVADHRKDLRAVIADVHMPHMDGVAFAGLLRRMLPEVPVAVASGRLDEHTTEQLRALGVTRFIQKPFTQDDLVDTLRELLGSRGPSNPG